MLTTTDSIVNNILLRMFSLVPTSSDCPLGVERRSFRRSPGDTSPMLSIQISSNME